MARGSDRSLATAAAATAATAAATAAAATAAIAAAAAGEVHGTSRPARTRRRRYPARAGTQLDGPSAPLEGRLAYAAEDVLLRVQPAVAQRHRLAVRRLADAADAELDSSLALHTLQPGTDDGLAAAVALHRHAYHEEVLLARIPLQAPLPPRLALGLGRAAATVTRRGAQVSLVTRGSRPREDLAAAALLVAALVRVAAADHVVAAADESEGEGEGEGWGQG